MFKFFLNWCSLFLINDLEIKIIDDNITQLLILRYLQKGCNREKNASDFVKLFKIFIEPLVSTIFQTVVNLKYRHFLFKSIPVIDTIS